MEQTFTNLESEITNAENCKQRGDFALAASIYKKSLAQQPNNAFLYDKLGQVKARSKDWGAAIANYQKAIELGLQSPFWTYKNLGDALREVKQYESAVASYQKAIALDARQPNVYDSLGQVQSLQGNYSLAIDNYQKAIELGILDPLWTYRNLGDALSNVGRESEAREIYQRGESIEAGNNSNSQSPATVNYEAGASSAGLDLHERGDAYFNEAQWAQALTFYRQAIELNPSYFWSHFNAARALHELEEWSEAIALARQALELDRGQASIVQPQLELSWRCLNQARRLQDESEVKDCLQEAASYFQQQQWSQAILLYQKAIAAQPDLGKSVYQRLGLAIVASQQTATKKSVSLKSEAISLDADEYYQQAEKSLAAGKIDEAIANHQRAIAQNPSFAVSYRALGDIYKRQNILDKAAEHYYKSVQLKPNYCHAYQRLGDVLQKQGNVDEAIAAYRRCLEINSQQTEVQKKLKQLLAESGPTAPEPAVPKLPSEYYQMGEAYYKEGKLDDALVAHQKAIELNPNLALSYRSIGDIFVRKGQPEKAIESYRQAIELKPNYYYGYQRLGRTLQQQGQTSKAIAAYRRALEIDPCQTQLQQTLNDLLPQSERLVPVPEVDRDRYPRVLVVAPIKFNQQAGGGVTMGNLFRGWHQSAIAQIHSDMFTEADYSVCSQYFYLPSKKLAAGEIPLAEKLLGWCREFKPDIIFARPIDRPSFYWWLPQLLAKELDIPFVTNVMDDWPARYEAREDLEEGDNSKSLLRSSLQNMFDGAAANIGISPQMCEAYEQRYGNQFVPFHNCIDVAEWSQVTKSYEIKEEFTLIYLGVVTEDKELWSLKDVRDTVLALRERGYKIKMQIYSAPFCQATIEQHLASPGAIEYAGYVHPSKLPQILSEADLLVLPINFDEASLKYVGYSIQTKVPEYMASGTPILAYGPAVSPNINYALRDNWGLVVDRPDKQRLAVAIAETIEDEQLRSRLGKYARDLAFRNHDAGVIRDAYRQLLADAAQINR